MSDSLRRYRAIRQALVQAYPKNPQGNLARHLNTLAALISGIVGSESVQLANIARKVPDGNQLESRVKRFTRWLTSDTIMEDVYFLPYAEALLRHLALETLVLVMDGSVVGRGCVALMVGVVYKGRLLPLAWLVRQGKKGHFSEDLHMTMVEQVKRLVPEDAQVMFLGDGEFDGIRLQQALKDYGWSYVCRTGSNIKVLWDGDTLRCDTLGACLKPGNLIAFIDVRLTKEAYGPVLVVCCWAKGEKDPRYVVSNMASAEEACHFYANDFGSNIFL